MSDRHNHLPPMSDINKLRLWMILHGIMPSVGWKPVAGNVDGVLFIISPDGVVCPLSKFYPEFMSRWKKQFERAALK